MIQRFDTGDLTTKFAGVIPDYAIEQHFSRKDTKKMDPFICYAIDAAEQAIADSGIRIPESDHNRIGVAIGSGIGGLPGIEELHITLEKDLLLVSTRADAVSEMRYQLAGKAFEHTASYDRAIADYLAKTPFTDVKPCYQT